MVQSTERKRLQAGNRVQTARTSWTGGGVAQCGGHGNLYVVGEGIGITGAGGGCVHAIQVDEMIDFTNLRYP